MALNVISKYIQDPKNPNASIINPQYNPKAQEDSFAAQLRGTISGETQKAPVSTIATAPTTPTTPAVSTLKDYYKTTSGTALPGVSDRAKTYESLGLGNASQYQGTYNQNLELLTKLANSKGLSVGGDVKASIGFNNEEKAATEEEPTTRAGLYSSLKDLLGIDKAEEEAPSKLEIYNKYMESVEADKTRLKGLDDTLSKLELSLKQSEDDIRNRISASGGVVTESQVQRLVAKEKQPLIDYYNELIDNRNKLAETITDATALAKEQADLEYEDKTANVTKLKEQLTTLYQIGEKDLADRIQQEKDDAEAKNGKYVGMQEDDKGNVSIIIQNADGTYEAKSMGAIGKVTKTSSTSTPSSYTEWILAGGEEGTGMTYAQFLGKSAGGSGGGVGTPENQKASINRVVGSLPAGQQDAAYGAIASFKNAKDILDLLDSGTSTGPLSGIKQGLQQTIGTSSSDFNKLQAAMTSFAANYIKGISGVAVSEQEYKRLMKALPSTTKQENVNRDAIEELLNTIKNKYETVLNVNFDDYPDEIPQVGVASQSQSRVTVISPDGAEGTIPADQLNDAISQGYKLKQ